MTMFPDRPGIPKTSPVVRDSNATFFTRLPDAKSVSVVGSFNDWNPGIHPMNAAGGGWWISSEISIGRPDKFQYMYMVDGETKVTDPLNLYVITNPDEDEPAFITWTDIPGMPEQMAGIHKSLLENHPGTGNFWIRDMCLNYIDEYLQRYGASRSTTIEHFLQLRLETVLTEMDKIKVDTGIYIWHIYNHGFIFRTPNNTFAIDIVSTRDSWNLYWAIPVDIVDRFVEKIDFAMVTHHHSDHADHEMITKFINSNKRVYALETMAGMIPDGFTGITPGQPINVNGMYISPHKGVHVYDNGRNIQLATYEIVTETGVRLLHTGDHDYTVNLEYEAIPDIVIPKFDGVTPMHDNEKVLDILFNYDKFGLIIPAHINELSHPPGGGRTSLRDAINQFKKCEMPYQIMTWGEGYHYS